MTYKFKVTVLRSKVELETKQAHAQPPPLVTMVIKFEKPAMNISSEMARKRFTKVNMVKAIVD